MTPFDVFVTVVLFGNMVAAAIAPWWAEKRRWDRMKKADWRDNPPVRA